MPQRSDPFLDQKVNVCGCGKGCGHKKGQVVWPMMTVRPDQIDSLLLGHTRVKIWLIWKINLIGISLTQDAALEVLPPSLKF